MTADEERTSDVQRVLEWLYQDELRHSRLIWRLESDARLEPPWPFRHLYYDPAGAVLVDLHGHPKLGGADPDWFQVDATDPVALGLLCGVRLPQHSEILCHGDLLPVLQTLGATETVGMLEVHVCWPGELGPAALPCEPTRLTPRHRAQVAEDGWRPDDLAEELDEEQGGVRWAILRDNRIVSRLLVQRVSEHLAEVADVQTAADARRRGFGAALVQNVVRRLHERGLGVTYSVHPSNRPSLALAASVGFRFAFRWQRVRVTRPWEE
ncbi:MAG: GNAT family N-acetyltransferase [Armatimonadetes bacterium]|nr:GNAT family N-acetyltransferase [Armatimonadota bacterium]